MTATPPRADLRTLAAEAKENTCDHPVYVHKIRGGEPLIVPICQLCGEIGWDDLREQIAEHRRMVLGEAAEAIDNTRFDLTIDGGPATGGFFRPETVLNAIRRLAAAAPLAGPSAPVPAGNAPAVPEETMARSWTEIERYACPLCGAGTGESCQTIGRRSRARSTAPHKARRVLCDGPEFDTKAARAAGWVPLADVLDAVWDIDAIQRWASRSGVPLGSFIGHQQIRDYLAERFASTTAPEGADERNGHG